MVADKFKIYIVLLSVLIIDQLTKFIAMRYSSDIFINKGITFFLFQENYFIVAAFFIFWFSLIAYLFYFQKLNGIALSFLLGGVASNLFDYLRLGGAIDWIIFYNNIIIFNLADLFIILGLGIWIYRNVQGVNS